jgi:rhomboid protease GluP
LFNKIDIKKYTRFLAYILIAINIAVFLVVEVTGGSTNQLHMVDMGAKFNPLILKGEWWRFFTPMFLHFGLMHLVMNMFSLYIMGPLVERIFGKIRFLFIYFVAGLFGVMASFVFTDGVSAGASGAIFGLFGALLFFGLIQNKFHFRIDLKQILVLVAVNLGFGLLTPGIDNSAHIGGLIGGFLTATLVYLPRLRNPLQQIAAAIAIISSVYFIFHFGYNQDVSQTDYAASMSFAEDKIRDKNFDEAKAFLDYYIVNEIIAPEAFTMAGFIEVNQENLKEGKKLFEKAIEQDDTYDVAYYYLGLVYYTENDFSNSNKYIEKAIDLNPSSEEYKNFYEEANK